nr:Chain C, HuD peptide [synthetic construct]3PWL_F Chain F, HuD peptide [synthetic construct]3PWP_C Chain C, HuD peptide [synthetic construct]
LGYGFVNYI